ncbi:MAG: hypothetical protein M1814_004806 [Vezdaea aestivalis]|nr:MAG: hypothetical protein M1814_004806 [Vezdaea aestivalis]
MLGLSVHFLVASLSLIICSVCAEKQIPTLTTVKTGTNTPTSTPALTQTGIVVTEPSSGPKSNQFDFFLTPDLRKTLQDTLGNDCKIADKEQCVMYLHSDLINAQVKSEGKIQKRASDPANINAFAAGSLAWKLEYDLQNAKDFQVPSYYGLDLGSMLDITDYSTMVVKVDSVTATLFAAPTATVSDPSQKYVVVPTFSPTLQDKV